MYDAIIAQHLSPLSPQPTEQSPKIEKLDGIKAVMFDIYGTLLISGSGDVGTAAATNRGDALAEAMKAVGLDFSGEPDAAIDDFRTMIESHHARLKAQGVDYPEVRIGEVWADCCRVWVEKQSLAKQPDEVEVSKLAIEYEMRVNPIWPMPGVRETLSGLRRKGKVQGVISNAQSFTPRLFSAAGRVIEELDSLEALGIDHELQVFSFELRVAKPSLRMYEEAFQALDDRGIRREQTLYVGNDMLNDITPASQIGFKTALFAGDARSLRLREDDERVAGVVPDLVITDLPQILDCV